MATPFEYFIAENTFHYNIVLERLEKRGIKHEFVQEKTVKFSSSETDVLAESLNGKTFNVLDWKEVEYEPVEHTEQAQKPHVRVAGAKTKSVKD